MSEVVLLQQILTAYNKLKIMSEVVLLLRNADSLHQVEDYVRGCSTSTKYWQPSAIWRLCQRMLYCYQILTAFNKLEIMSDVVLLLPTTDSLQQVEDYVSIVLLLRNRDSLQQVEDYIKGCSTATKYWQPSTSWRLCQRLFYSTKYWQPSTSLRLCQTLFYFCEILTAFN